MDRRAGGAVSAAHAPWTIRLGAVVLVFEAVVGLRHAARLLRGVDLAEETLGLAALRPLGHEATTLTLLFYAALGLFVAAVVLFRRSRLALCYAAVVQALVVVDALARFVRGLPVLPAVLLLAVAIPTFGLLLSRSARRWCVAPAPPPGTEAGAG
jgi:hypothetical protein